MPKKKKTETNKQFISRCIPVVLSEGKTKSAKQAAAICYNILKN
jgi:hypothetical protein